MHAMEFRIDQTIEILRTTPHVLRASLKDVSEPWVNNNYGDKTFSPFDIVGHLIGATRRLSFQVSEPTEISAVLAASAGAQGTRKADQSQI